MISPIYKVPYRFIVFTILFLVIDFTIDNINHRFVMGDFKVYYGAANAIASGKQLYGVLFSPGSGYYKYSPLMAFAFYPLSILPYYIACLVNYVLISVAIVLTGIFVLHIFNTYVFNNTVKSPNVILSVAILCITIHLIRELGLGNMNMILLLLLCLSLYGILQGRFILAGIPLAIVLITKPFLVIVLIPLVLRRYFKTVSTTAILLALFAILPSLLVGVGMDVSLHNQWLNTMIIHANGFPSSNTLDALIRNNFHWFTSDALQYIILSVVLTAYMLYIRWDMVQERESGANQSQNLIMEWFSIIAMIPCLFRTDTEHFLMSWPLIIFMLIYLFNTKNIALSIIFIAIVLLYAGNSSDLLGRELSYRMNDIGLLGISNVLLTLFALYIYRSKVMLQGKMALVAE
jgi:hypothetical protein